MTLTLILKPDLDMVTMYPHTQKWSFYVKGFKSFGLNRQTEMIENITYPHTRVVMIDFWEQDRSISTPLSIVINTVHPWAKGLIKTSTSWELALKNLLFKRTGAV